MYIIIDKCIHSGVEMVIDLGHFQSPMKYFLHTEILSKWSVYYTTTKMLFFFSNISKRISVDEYVLVFHAECRLMKYLLFDELALPQCKDLTNEQYGLPIRSAYFPAKHLSIFSHKLKF